MRLEVVVFDAYGTLFDVYSVGHLADTLYPGQGGRLPRSGATSSWNTAAWCR